MKYILFIYSDWPIEIYMWNLLSSEDIGFVHGEVLQAKGKKKIANPHNKHENETLEVW